MNEIERIEQALATRDAHREKFVQSVDPRMQCIAHTTQREPVFAGSSKLSTKQKRELKAGGYSYGRWLCRNGIVQGWA